ncbi:MAG: hypothetical protein LDL44_19475 [Caenispirillum sp.]|nr:hypothetical protein [Caenispirillum sp.]
MNAPFSGDFQRPEEESRRSIVDLLRQDGPEADFDFEPPRLAGPLPRPEEGRALIAPWT